MMRSMTLTALASVLALAACGAHGKRAMFEGHNYPSKLKKTGDRPEVFTVTVGDVVQGVAGAREAGNFEATTYCVNTFGDSDITWQPGYGPRDSHAITENGILILRGSCAIW